jgi:hypothetical protein
MPALDSPEMQQLALGNLTRIVSLSTVLTKLTQQQCASKNQCKLPAHFMVYFLIAMAWKKTDPYREVWRWLRMGLQTLWGLDKLPAAVVTKAAITVARGRLKWQALRELFRACALPMATRHTPGAFYRRWRLVSVDGTTLATPDTAKNRDAFGKPGSGNGEGAFPLVKVVTLVEVGTHAIIGIALDAWRTAETTLVRDLLPLLGPSMLCLADREYFSYALWTEACATGVQLVWRLKKNMILPCERPLPDGSYLSRVYPSTQAREAKQDGIRVRVIEYTLPDVSGAEPVYRLITTVLSPKQAPALELAGLYPERWENEGVLKEVKTFLLGGADAVLRSQSPDFVRQEIYGLMLAHYAVRSVMFDAAKMAKEDPDRISFRHTVRVLCRTLPEGAALPPSEVVTMVSEGIGRGVTRTSRFQPRAVTSAGDPATHFQISVAKEC